MNIGNWIAIIGLSVTVITVVVGAAWAIVMKLSAISFRVGEIVTSTNKVGDELRDLKTEVKALANGHSDHSQRLARLEERTEN